MTRHPRLYVLLSAATIMAAPAALAQQPTALALSCAACHGTDGKSPGSIPILAGRPAKELKDALVAFKAGTRPSTVMTRLAKGYTDPEIDALADYFSKRK